MTRICSSSQVQTYSKSKHKDIVQNTSADNIAMRSNKTIKRFYIKGSRLPIKFNTLFFFYCFHCCQYGYKVSECRLVMRRRSSFMNRYSFDSIMSLIFFNCYKLSHIDKLFRLSIDQQN